MRVFNEFSSGFHDTQESMFSHLSGDHHEVERGLQLWPIEQGPKNKAVRKKDRRWNCKINRLSIWHFGNWVLFLSYLTSNSKPGRRFAWYVRSIIYSNLRSISDTCRLKALKEPFCKAAFLLPCCFRCEMVVYVVKTIHFNFWMVRIQSITMSILMIF